MPLVAANALWITCAAWLLTAASEQHARRGAHHLAPAAVAPPPLATRIAGAEPLILALMAPALLFPTRTRLIVLAAVPVLMWAQRRVTGRVLPPTPLNLCLYGLLGMTAVSVAVTFDLHNSLGKVAGVVLGTLVFWTATRWTNSAARLRIATGVFLTAGAVLAVIGLFGTNWFGKFGLLAPIVDRLPKTIRGVPGAEEGFQPNAVAGCLVLFIPVQMALLWLSRRRSRGATLMQAALLALTTGTLVLTQSRGAWSGLGIALLAFLFWYRRGTRIIGAVLVAGAALTAVTLGLHRFADLAISQSGPAMTQNVSSRVELWSRAIDAIQDFPITGMGMNSFRRLMPTMYPTVLATPDLDVAHAHNHLLQAALDLGLPGLIVYLAIWITIARVLWRTYRTATDTHARALTGGLGAGLIAHFVFGLADVIPLGSKVGVLFWLTLALAVSVHQLSLTTDTSSTPL